MLGKGIYGAPDPRKPKQYCGKSKQDCPNGKFMFLCVFNLSAKEVKDAGPTTEHRNSHFEEFCVFEEKHAVVLWQLKVKDA